MTLGDGYSLVGLEIVEKLCVSSVVSTEAENESSANSSDIGTLLSDSEVRESVRLPLTLSEQIYITCTEFNDVEVYIDRAAGQKGQFHVGLDTVLYVLRPSKLRRMTCWRRSYRILYTLSR